MYYLINKKKYKWRIRISDFTTELLLLLTYYGLVFGPNKVFYNNMNNTDNFVAIFHSLTCQKSSVISAVECIISGSVDHTVIRNSSHLGKCTYNKNMCFHTKCSNPY